MARRYANGNQSSKINQIARIYGALAHGIVMRLDAELINECINIANKDGHRCNVIKCPMHQKQRKAPRINATIWLSVRALASIPNDLQMKPIK